MKNIEEVKMSGGVTFYTDDAGHKYGRIVGGIGWKGKRPGFIVSVAEDLEPDKNVNGAFHYWVIEEYEQGDTIQLLNKAIEFRQYLYCNPWLADTENKLEISFLDQVNSEISHYEDKFYIQKAPNADDPKSIQFCLKAIELCLKPKILHIGESKIQGYLNEITDENRDSLSSGDCPVIISLGNAIAYMREHPVDPYRYSDYSPDEDGNKRYNYLTGDLE